MAAIEIRGLDVVRGGRSVLRRIDLTVGDGMVTGLLGPSGSGKTTMMRCIVGLQRYQGSLQVLGREAGEPSLRSDVGYMTQSPSVYPDLSAGANVGYHAALHGRARGAVAEALGMVGLADRGGQLVGTMSGGERSRVSLGCALVAQPSMLVLDEPTVGLDPVLRRDLWHLFRAMSAERGVTLLVSSHVMDEAHRCDELVLLREGQLLAHDAPDELLARTGAREMEEAFLKLIETTPEVSR